MKYILANWKMYLDNAESLSLAESLADVAVESEKTVVLFPSTLAFSQVKWALQDSSFLLGAQNVAFSPRGAYTGAVSAEIFYSAGARYALVGHSERRHIFGETDTAVRQKMQACFEAGIIPVLCIGETQEDTQAGKRQYRLKQQLSAVFSQLEAPIGSFLLAYEPVWAIGSGESCLPADVSDVHGFLQDEMKQYTKQPVPILYGGSVTKENVVSYTSLSEVDGVLIGGASTTVESFSRILELV